MRMLDEEMAKRPDRMIPGAIAFRLYDTYGFPFDLTRVIAAGNHFTVDEAGFEASMDEQRQRAEFVGSGELAVEGVFQSILDRVGPTKFLGYEETTGKSQIVAIVAEGKEVTSVAAPCNGSGGCHLPRNPVLRRAGRPDRRHGYGDRTARRAQGDR